MAENTKDGPVLQPDREFTLMAVPRDKRRSTYDQVNVWIGFGYVVTGLVVGGNLAGYGGAPGMAPGKAMLAIALGMGSLFLITSFLGIAAHNTGFNLALLSRYSYGKKGIIIPMAIMALLTLGWFASITGMVGDIWGAFIGNPTGVIVFDPAKVGYPGIAPITLEVFLCCAVWGTVFTITAIKGISAIEWIAKLVSPLILLAAIVVGIIFLVQAGGIGEFSKKASTLTGLGIGSGVTFVVGSWISGAVTGVDLFRFNKNIGAVFLGGAACFIFTNPILNIVGYIGTVHAGDFNYVKWMLTVNLLIAIFGVFVWTASLWTTNNSELYSNAIYSGNTLEAFGFKNVNRTKLVAICGIVGTVLGALAFYQILFSAFINALGSMAPPVAAPILADYYLIDRRKYSEKLLNKQPPARWAGIVSYVIGAALGFVWQYVAPLPYGLPSGIAAMIVSFAVYYIIYRFTPDKGIDESLVKTI